MASAGLHVDPCSPTPCCAKTIVLAGIAVAAECVPHGASGRRPRRTSSSPSCATAMRPGSGPPSLSLRARRAQRPRRHLLDERLDRGGPDPDAQRDAGDQHDPVRRHVGTIAAAAAAAAFAAGAADASRQRHWWLSSSSLRRCGVRRGVAAAAQPAPGEARECRCPDGEQRERGPCRSRSQPAVARARQPFVAQCRQAREGFRRATNPRPRCEQGFGPVLPPRRANA